MPELVSILEGEKLVDPVTLGESEEEYDAWLESVELADGDS